MIHEGGGMRRRIYLAGHMNPVHPRTLEWRDEAEYILSGEFHVINPVAGVDWEDPKFISTQGMASSDKPSRAIFRQDFCNIMSSDLVLANLDVYPGRQMIGTHYEMAWAYTKPIPVIAFYEFDRRFQHPFVVESITEAIFGLEPACDLILAEY
jgi:nucleoside 2-deoxyribosyltransferase